MYNTEAPDCPAGFVLGTTILECLARCCAHDERPQEAIPLFRQADSIYQLYAPGLANCDCLRRLADVHFKLKLQEHEKPIRVLECIKSQMTQFPAGTS